MNDDQLRIGDAERAAAAADLGEHFAQGRLTADEHEERLAGIWAARTHRDLAPVFADLPSPYAAPRPSRAAPHANPTAWAPYGPPTSGLRDRAGDLRRRLPVPLVAVLAVLAALVILANLPVVLVALLVFWLVAHGRHDRRWRRHPRHGWRY